MKPVFIIEIKSSVLGFITPDNSQLHNRFDYKSAYNSLLLLVQVWDGKPTYRKSWAGNLLVWADLTLDPSFKVKRG